MTIHKPLEYYSMRDVRREMRDDLMTMQIRSLPKPPDLQIKLPHWFYCPRCLRRSRVLLAEIDGQVKCDECGKAFDRFVQAERGRLLRVVEETDDEQNDAAAILVLA